MGSLSKMYKRARAEALRQHALVVDADPPTEEELDEAIDDVLARWSEDAAHDREVFGEPYDTDCIESGRDNCDDWGTGEGQYHGRI